MNPTGKCKIRNENRFSFAPTRLSSLLHLNTPPPLPSLNHVSFFHRPSTPTRPVPRRNAVSAILKPYQSNPAIRSIKIMHSLDFSSPTPQGKKKKGGGGSAGIDTYHVPRKSKTPDQGPTSQLLSPVHVDFDFNLSLKIHIPKTHPRSCFPFSLLPAVTLD